MKRIDPFIAEIYAEIDAEERAAQAMRQSLIAAREAVVMAGPPTSSGITPANWSSSVLYGYWSCPGIRDYWTCREAACVCGSECLVLRAKGLDGRGKALPKRVRPCCGAQTRTGRACKMHVVPGRQRCRLHGGLSTGPKSAEGRANISHAQQERWAKYRSDLARIRASMSQRPG